MEKEIWFDKILWSYFPCHWKGWLSLFATVFAAVVSIFILRFITTLSGRPDLQDLAYLAFFPFFIIFMILAKRHS